MLFGDNKKIYIAKLLNYQNINGLQIEIIDNNIMLKPNDINSLYIKTSLPKGMADVKKINFFVLLRGKNKKIIEFKGIKNIVAKIVNKQQIQFFLPSFDNLKNKPYYIQLIGTAKNHKLFIRISPTYKVLQH
ncbi:MAG: hypothetical protein ACK5H1_00240 [Tenacibaculum sp.]